MPMYNLLEYSKKYSKATGSLWNYHRLEPNNPPPNPPVGNNPPTVDYSADPSQILSLLYTKEVLQEKHPMQIKKTM